MAGWLNIDIDKRLAMFLLGFPGQTHQVTTHSIAIAIAIAIIILILVIVCAVFDLSNF